MKPSLPPSTVTFDTVQFIRDLAYHIFSAGGCMIAYPMCRLVESDDTARNRLFLPGKGRPPQAFFIQNFFGSWAVEWRGGDVVVRKCVCEGTERVWRDRDVMIRNPIKCIFSPSLTDFDAHLVLCGPEISWYG